MAYNTPNDNTTPNTGNRLPLDRNDPGTVPAQPGAKAAIKGTAPVLIFLAVVILIIGLANAGSLFSGGKKTPPKSALANTPKGASAQDVTRFQAQQQQLQEKDTEIEQRNRQLMAQLQRDQESEPGRESADAPAMTAAQRRAMYGDNNPNAPAKTSNLTQAQAEAHQRALLRAKQQQDALNSDTVAIDFATSQTSAPPAREKRMAGTATPSTDAAERIGQVIATAEERENRKTPKPLNAPETDSNDSGAPSVVNTAESRGPGKNPLASYDFDAYQGRLYRVFEGTVFEGVVTNHIDGGLSGPMLVMLTTDYYSHDHQQLLLPQGTRLIGSVQSVGSGQQRKLFVVFNRAVCPDGFSIDLNKYTGLDPLGTTGLATNVDNHYLSSFAAAAAVGGLGGLAQLGNSGSVLDSSTQIRNGISTQTAQEGEQILNRFLNRLPVITVKEGSRARVYINRDILLPSYADHRVDPIL